MNVKRRITNVILLLFLGLNLLQAQRFKSEIEAFRKQDSIALPSKNAILFVGSSSFARWKDVASYFPDFSIINRGFGGSTLLDLIHYEKEVIFPYHPKQIVIYCGENDIASSDSISGKKVFERFKTLYQDIRKVYPDISIVYISMKPSPSRWNMKKRMIKGNKLIKQFMKSQDNTAYVSVWKPMLGTNKKPNTAIFLSDKLHLNSEGYAIWQKIIGAVLLK